MELSKINLNIIGNYIHLFSRILYILRLLKMFLDYLKYNKIKLLVIMKNLYSNLFLSGIILKYNLNFLLKNFIYFQMSYYKIYYKYSNLINFILILIYLEDNF